MATSPKVSILDLQQKKVEGRPITMLTAYDYSGASLVDEAGLDLILVGDSLAMTVLGHPNTVSVTVEEMLPTAKPSPRAKRAFLLAIAFHGPIRSSAAKLFASWPF